MKNKKTHYSTSDATLDVCVSIGFVLYTRLHHQLDLNSGQERAFWKAVFSKAYFIILFSFLSFSR